jgi:hypothetical protein
MQDVAITVRIPSTLKDAVDAHCASRGVTLTRVVRDALEGLVAPSPERVFELPGMSDAFTKFIREHSNQRRVLLLVASTQGRAHVEGKIDGNLSNESMVTLNPPGRRGLIPLLRRDVVGWFEAGDASDELTRVLDRSGWRPMFSYMP